MKHTKPMSKAQIWNTYICPAIEVAAYGLAALLLCASMYAAVVVMILLAG